MSAANSIHPTHRGDDFSRGLGILLFRNRSSTHAIGIFVLLVMLLWAALSVGAVMALHDQHQLVDAGSVTVSYLLNAFGVAPASRWPVWTQDGWDKWPSAAILAEPYFVDRAHAVGRTIFWSWLVTGILMIPLAMVAHRRITSYGRRMVAGKYLRGAIKLDDQALAKLIRKRREASPLRIGRLPIPSTTECEHLAFIGSPGTGKTLAIMQLLDHVRARGDAAVIYDSKGIFTSHYYDPGRGDVLLNPLDARTRPWTPWAEIEDQMDADRIAHALIPAGDHSTPFWHDSARAMLSAALSKLRRQNRCDLEQLLHLLLHAADEVRQDFFRGTDVAQIFDHGGERMRMSVEQNVRTYLRSLRHLPLDSGGENDFSILEHIRSIDVRSGPQPWLFLPSPLKAKHFSIKPLLTCWMDCAAAALLSCGERRDRRCWFIMDEVKSLYHVPMLADLMAEGRGFGACVVLGFQDLAQLRRVYGEDDAKTMSAVLGTKVLFKIADPETASWAADALGKVEEEHVKESTRYDANGERSAGVQLQSQRVERHLVMPAELQRLPRFHCYVQLSGDWPIAETRIPDPRASERPCLAPSIEYGDPDRSFAAIVADVPDPPAEADDDSGPSTTQPSGLEQPAATTPRPIPTGKPAKVASSEAKPAGTSTAKPIRLNGLDIQG